MAATKTKEREALDEAKKTTGELVEAKEGGVPMEIDLEADSGKGFEGTSADSFVIPYLTILQKNSPQCDPDNKAEYIAEAKPGMLFNTATRQIFDVDKAPAIVIPCAYQQRFAKWRDRDKGGGFQGVFLPDDPIVQAAMKSRDSRGRYWLDEEWYLADTRYHYCLHLYEGGASRVVLGMASTQLKKSRRWMTRMDNVRLPSKSGGQFCPPSFAFAYEITTVPESNDSGSWRGWKIEPGERVTRSDVYAAAKEFNRLVAAGIVEAAAPTDDGAGPTGGGSDSGDLDDKEIPF